MRIMVTNDDGIASGGLRALALALASDGHEIVVVAPADDRSGSGASLGGLHRDGTMDLVAHRWRELSGVEVYSIDAPPATAVLAVCHGAFGPVPDLVASGINPGANTGHLLIHSGTVGAALTAAGAGVPGLAVSLSARPKDSRDGLHWSTAGALAAAAVEWVTKPDGGPRILNLNVPNVSIAELRGVREARLADLGEVWVAAADPAAGDLKLDFHGATRDPGTDTDLALLREGYATVTPLAPLERAPLEGAADGVMSALA